MAEIRLSVNVIMDINQFCVTGMLCSQSATGYGVPSNSEASNSGAYYWKAVKVGCKFVLYHLLRQLGVKIHRVGN